MKNKTLAEVYKNASDEVKEILKSKFDNSELGIRYDEIEIKNEILSLIKNNIKNIKFLDENGNHIEVPSNRFEICDEDGNWIFDIDYGKKNKHFWYSHYKVFKVFESKYGVSYVKFNKILKGILLDEELNLKGVTPHYQI